jgi:hypothetical protein
LTLNATEKKLYILWRLIENDDRLIRQRPVECFPDSVWFLLHPQMAPGEMLGATKWLERRGFIIESIAPTTGEAPSNVMTPPNDLRKYYQSEWRHRVYAASPAGVDWYWHGCP